MADRMIAAIVTGRVQGVGFRAWTREEAVARGLRGWVRNRSDGSVEVLMAGKAAEVDDMLKALSRGPAAAKVEAVDSGPAPDTNLPPRFDIRR